MYGLAVFRQPDGFIIWSPVGDVTNLSSQKILNLEKEMRGEFLEVVSSVDAIIQKRDWGWYLPDSLYLKNLPTRGH